MKCPQCGFEPRLKPLTRRQREIFDFLAAYGREHGYAPTFAEIAEHWGYQSLATVHEHMTNLERKGWLDRRYNEARAIVLHGADTGDSP